VDNFVERARLLGKKLGPLLYQLPPRMKLDKALLPLEEGNEVGELDADFDEPGSIDELAAFFRSSGGVTLTY
jgi:hypothetical protein